MKRSAFLFLVIGLLVHAHAQTAQPFVANRFTSFDGTKIYFEIHGTGKPIFLVHGFTNTAESWKKKPIFSDLQKKGYQVIIVDLRGNGRSDKPLNEQAYQNDAEAKDIMKLADTLKLPSYSAIGYSRGSIIVSRLLVLDKRIIRGVMGGMGSDFTNPQWPRRIMFYEVLAGKRPVGELDGFMKYVQENKFDTRVLALQQLGQPFTSEDELGKIRNRVLVISGTDDHDNGSAEDLALLMPRSDYMTVPGNHNNASQNQEFSDAVVGFLQSP